MARVSSAVHLNVSGAFFRTLNDALTTITSVRDDDASAAQAPGNRGGQSSSLAVNPNVASMHMYNSGAALVRMLLFYNSCYFCNLKNSYYC